MRLICYNIYKGGKSIRFSPVESLSSSPSLRAEGKVERKAERPVESLPVESLKVERKVERQSKLTLCICP